MLEINNTTGRKVDARRLATLAEKFLRAYRRKGDVSLALVGPARMRRLNRDYRGFDKTTDVLSFPAEPPAEKAAKTAVRPYLGEIIINMAEASKVRKYEAMLVELDLPPFSSRRKAQEYIFFFLFVHGLLHLIGYDDAAPGERREMLVRGRDFLKKML